MKTKFLSRIILVGVAVLLLEACASTASGPAAGLAGTWTNSMGTVWTMRADGTFDVDLNRDGNRDAWGTCTFNGDMVTIAGTGGTVPKGCMDTKGIYHFTRTGDTLHFVYVDDPCKLRKENVTQVWTKK